MMSIDYENLRGIRKCFLPATRCPEQIIFERRDDGLYDMDVKFYATDSNDKSRTIIVHEKCVVELPNWINGIPVAVKIQDDGVLYRIEIPEDMKKIKVFND